MCLTLYTFNKLTTVSNGCEIVCKVKCVRDCSVGGGLFFLRGKGRVCVSNVSTLPSSTVVKMKADRLLWPFLYLVVTCSCVNGLIERLYCGKHNCYEGIN